MNEKQARFVEEYCVDFNATQAAIRVGYSEKTAYSQGQRLLKHAEVAAAIADRKKSLSERSELNEKYVLDTLRSIADDKDQPGAARVTAATNIGKHLGMFVERSINENHNFNADVSDEIMDPEEWAQSAKPH